MTHKEKAQELVDKFKFDCRIEYECRPLSVNQIAKQCALIAVDEIYLVESGYFGDYGNAPYWQQVKQEIEKL
jgi:hypothetical protein